MEQSKDQFTLETALSFILGDETEGNIMTLTEQLNRLSEALGAVDTSAINLKGINKEVTDMLKSLKGENAINADFTNLKANLERGVASALANMKFTFTNKRELVVPLYDIDQDMQKQLERYLTTRASNVTIKDGGKRPSMVIEVDREIEDKVKRRIREITGLGSDFIEVKKLDEINTSLPASVYRDIESQFKEVIKNSISADNIRFTRGKPLRIVFGDEQTRFISDKVSEAFSRQFDSKNLKIDYLNKEGSKTPLYLTINKSQVEKIASSIQRNIIDELVKPENMRIDLPKIKSGNNITQDVNDKVSNMISDAVNRTGDKIDFKAINLPKIKVGEEVLEMLRNYVKTVDEVSKDLFLTEKDSKLLKEVSTIAKNMEGFKNKFISNFKPLVDMVKQLESEVDSRKAVPKDKEINLGNLVKGINDFYVLVGNIQKQLETETKNIETLKTVNLDLSTFNSNVSSLIVNAATLIDTLNKLDFSKESENVKELNNNISNMKVAVIKGIGNFVKTIIDSVTRNNDSDDTKEVVSKLKLVDNAISSYIDATISTYLTELASLDKGEAETIKEKVGIVTKKLEDSLSKALVSYAENLSIEYEADNFNAIKTSATLLDRKLNEFIETKKEVLDRATESLMVLEFKGSEDSGTELAIHAKLLNKKVVDIIESDLTKVKELSNKLSTQLLSVGKEEKLESLTSALKSNVQTMSEGIDRLVKDKIEIVTNINDNINTLKEQTSPDFNISEVIGKGTDSVEKALRQVLERTVNDFVSKMESITSNVSKQNVENLIATTVSESITSVIRTEQEKVLNAILKSNKDLIKQITNSTVNALKESSKEFTEFEVEVPYEKIEREVRRKLATFINKVVKSTKLASFGDVEEKQVKIPKTVMNELMKDLREIVLNNLNKMVAGVEVDVPKTQVTSLNKAIQEQTELVVQNIIERLKTVMQVVREGVSGSTMSLSLEDHTLIRTEIDNGVRNIIKDVSFVMEQTLTALRITDQALIEAKQVIENSVSDLKNAKIGGEVDLAAEVNKTLTEINRFMVNVLNAWTIPEDAPKINKASEIINVIQSAVGKLVSEVKKDINSQLDQAIESASDKDKSKVETIKNSVDRFVKRYINQVNKSITSTTLEVLTASEVAEIFSPVKGSVARVLSAYVKQISEVIGTLPVSPDEFSIKRSALGRDVNRILADKEGLNSVTELPDTLQGEGWKKKVIQAIINQSSNNLYEILAKKTLGVADDLAKDLHELDISTVGVQGVGLNDFIKPRFIKVQEMLVGKVREIISEQFRAIYNIIEQIQISPLSVSASDLGNLHDEVLQAQRKTANRTETSKEPQDFLFVDEDRSTKKVKPISKIISNTDFQSIFDPMSNEFNSMIDLIEKRSLINAQRFRNTFPVEKLTEDIHRQVEEMLSTYINNIKNVTGQMRAFADDPQKLKVLRENIASEDMQLAYYATKFKGDEFKWLQEAVKLSDQYDSFALKKLRGESSLLSPSSSLSETSRENLKKELKDYDERARKIAETSILSGEDVKKVQEQFKKLNKEMAETLAVYGKINKEDRLFTQKQELGAKIREFMQDSNVRNSEPLNQLLHSIDNITKQSELKEARANFQRFRREINQDLTLDEKIEKYKNESARFIEDSLRNLNHIDSDFRRKLSSTDYTEFKSHLENIKQSIEAFSTKGIVSEEGIKRSREHIQTLKAELDELRKKWGGSFKDDAFDISKRRELLNISKAYYKYRDVLPIESFRDLGIEFRKAKSKTDLDEVALLRRTLEAQGRVETDKLKLQKKLAERGEMFGQSQLLTGQHITAEVLKKALSAMPKLQGYDILSQSINEKTGTWTATVQNQLDGSIVRFSGELDKLTGTLYKNSESLRSVANSLTGMSRTLSTDFRSNYLTAKRQYLPTDYSQFEVKGSPPIDPGGDTRSFMGSVINTMRYITAGALIGAPYGMFRKSWESEKEFDYQLVKAQSNFLAKSPGIGEFGPMWTVSFDRVLEKVERGMIDLGELKKGSEEYNKKILHEIEKDRKVMESFTGRGAAQSLQQIAIAHAMPLADVGFAYHIASRNIDDPIEAIKFVENIAKMNVTEEIPIDVAAKGLESISAQWGFVGEELDRVTNAMIMVANLSAITLEEVIDIQARSGVTFKQSMPNKSDEEAFISSLALSAIYQRATAKSGKMGGTFFKSVLLNPTRSQEAKYFEDWAKNLNIPELNPVDPKTGKSRDFDEFLGAVMEGISIVSSDISKTEMMQMLSKRWHMADTSAIMTFIESMATDDMAREVRSLANFSQELLDMYEKATGRDAAEETGISKYNPLGILTEKIKQGDDALIGMMLADYMGTWKFMTNRLSTEWEVTTSDMINAFKPEAMKLTMTLSKFLELLRDNAYEIAQFASAAKDIAMAMLIRWGGIKAKDKVVDVVREGHAKKVDNVAKVLNARAAGLNMERILLEDRLALPETRVAEERLWTEIENKKKKMQRRQLTILSLEQEEIEMKEQLKTGLLSQADYDERKRIRDSELASLKEKVSGDKKTIDELMSRSVQSKMAEVSVQANMLNKQMDLLKEAARDQGVSAEMLQVQMHKVAETFEGGSVAPELYAKSLEKYMEGQELSSEQLELFAKEHARIEALHKSGAISAKEYANSMERLSRAHKTYNAGLKGGGMGGQGLTTTDLYTGAALTSLIAQNNDTFSNRPDVKTRAMSLGLVMGGLFNPNATIGGHSAERLGDPNVTTNRQALWKALEHDYNFTGQKMREFGKGLGAGAINFAAAAGRFVWQIGLITAAMNALEFTIRRLNATPGEIAMEQAVDTKSIEDFYLNMIDRRGKGGLAPVFDTFSKIWMYTKGISKDFLVGISGDGWDWHNFKEFHRAAGIYADAVNRRLNKERIKEIIEEMYPSEKEGKTDKEIREMAEQRLKEEAKGKLTRGEYLARLAQSKKYEEDMAKAKSKDYVLLGTMNKGFEVKRRAEIFTEEDARRIFERYIEKTQKALESNQLLERIAINEGILKGYNENDPALIVIKKEFADKEVNAQKELLEDMKAEYKLLEEQAKEEKYREYLSEEHERRKKEDPKFGTMYKTALDMPEEIKDYVRGKFEKDLAEGVITMEDIKSIFPAFAEADMIINAKEADLSDAELRRHRIALEELTRRIEVLNRNLSIIRSEGEISRGNLLLSGQRELSEAVRQSEMMTLLEEYNERAEAIKELEAKRQELLSKGKTDDANNLYEQLKGLEAQNIENLLSQRELRYKVIDDILDLGNYGKNVRTLQHEIQRNKLIASGIQADSPYITQVNIRMYREMIKLLGDTVEQLRAQTDQWAGDEEKSRQLNLQILEHQAEQSRYMASIQEELMKGGATFNLPDGIIPITQYDSLTSSGTHRYLTVQSGNVQINIMVDKMTGNEQDLERLATKTAKEIEKSRGINVADQLSIMNQRSGYGNPFPY